MHMRPSAGARGLTPSGHVPPRFQVAHGDEFRLPRVKAKTLPYDSTLATERLANTTERLANTTERLANTTEAPRIVVRADWGALGRRASRCTDVARFAAALRRSLGGHTAERGVADLLVDVPVGRGDVRGQPGHVFAQLLHGVCHLVHPVARLELVRHHQVHVHHGGAFDMRLHGLARTRVRAPHLAVRARDDGSWARGPVGAHIGAADLVTARALLYLPCLPTTSEASMGWRHRGHDMLRSANVAVHGSQA
eukprot:CAMPEP_0205853340 /NCGR_PEP_ID=MMETSP1083-20121108/1502_1 /ASSEMBLY_ACC=CAM_ASM_000430 /TAXON_ID=97485 /ORGANISM="Prymnesium parvum, Strain Texoma1" /LENGTH=251 /DNA_ID=CAMNT_0053214607 /DNA_START=102 /DNA_END=858 /DNA_ORIENTATION=+